MAVPFCPLLKRLHRIARWFPALVVLIVALPVPARAAEEIKVPFNFSWGESASRLESSLKSVKARVVERKDVRGRQCLVVEDIPQKLLQRALFYFESDALNEIELHYGDEQWDSARYGTFFEQTRQNIEKKYGPGRVIARQRTREGDMLQTLVGYQWVQPITSLALYYYTAEQGAQTFRLLSLHYRGF
ncbi:MAG: hypothetical protein Fur0032_06410 [Terrimicrobiaceae bacterium]